MRRRFLWWLDDKLRRWAFRFPWLVEVRDIYDRDGEELYMTRYHLLSKQTSRYSLMLHHMHRADNDACHHDHPWTFVTLILVGGYMEEVTYSIDPDDWSMRPLQSGESYLREGHEPGTYIVRRFNWPGWFRLMRADHTHRIAALLERDAWTLVFRLPKSRSWGFHTTQGFVPWRDFINMRRAFGVLWCGRDEE